MTSQRDMSEWKSSARGESAWKEAREGVASRNDEVTKSGKLEREGYERNREANRVSAAAKRHAEMLHRRAK